MKHIENIAAFMVSLVAMAIITEPLHASEIRLDKPGLRRLFIGNTLTLEHKGRRTLQYTAANGEVTQEIYQSDRKTGRWKIAGKRNPRICYSFPASPEKCFVVLKDDLSDAVLIRKYKNKRADKLVFRVIDRERGNRLTAITPLFEPDPTREPQVRFSPPPPPVAELLRLSRKKIRQIQFVLGKRGFDAGPVDGIMGAKTRDAIADYQQFIDQPPTGDLTQDQMNKLLRGSGKFGPVPSGAKRTVKKPAPALSESPPEETKSADKPLKSQTKLPPGEGPASPKLTEQAPDTGTASGEAPVAKKQPEKTLKSDIGPEKPKISDLDSF